MKVSRKIGNRLQSKHYENTMNNLLNLSVFSLSNLIRILRVSSETEVG